MADISQIKVNNTTYTIKDSNALRSHPSIAQSSNTTSSASPSGGSTFTVIDSITKDSNGHVTKYNTKTVTMPTVSSGSGGTTDYSALTNKPSINGVTLSGNKTSSDLGLASSSHTHTIANVTDLQTTLNGKASASHSHTSADITDLTNTINSAIETAIGSAIGGSY